MKKYLLILASGLVLSCAQAGTVTTFAGAGAKGFSGDGGPASQAELNNPYAIARGPDGFLYICDVDNARIRRIGADGRIETYAGEVKDQPRNFDNPEIGKWRGAFGWIADEVRIRNAANGSESSTHAHWQCAKLNKSRNDTALLS